jgi:hypothetical protein
MKSPMRSPKHRESIESRKENSKEILKALNEDAAVARHVWIGFNLLLAFITVTAVSISHEDLLFDHPVKLPILDVGMPLSQFALLAPALILTIYFAVLV